MLPEGSAGWITAQAVALPDLFGEIARTGLLGVVAVLAIYWAIRKDKELAQERRERLEDAKAAIQVASTSSDAIDRLAEAVRQMGAK